MTFLHPTGEILQLRHCLGLVGKVEKCRV